MKVELELRAKIGKTTHALFKEWPDITESPFFRKINAVDGIGSNPMTVGWPVTVGVFRMFPVYKDTSDEWSIGFTALDSNNFHYPDKTVVVADLSGIYQNGVLKKRVTFRLLMFIIQRGAFFLD